MEKWDLKFVSIFFSPVFWYLAKQNQSDQSWWDVNIIELLCSSIDHWIWIDSGKKNQIKSKSKIISKPIFHRFNFIFFFIFSPNFRSCIPSSLKGNIFPERFERVTKQCLHTSINPEWNVCQRSVLNTIVKCYVQKDLGIWIRLNMAYQISKESWTPLFNQIMVSGHFDWSLEFHGSNLSLFLFP